MPADQQCSRIDTMELKLQIVKNLGKRKAAKYFKNLERYLTLKINKQQFQKRCYSTIGNENAKLHNCLINAILGNANLAKAKQTLPASQTQNDHDTKLSTGSVGHGPLPVRTQYPQFTKLLRGSLGDSLEVSPRKARSKKHHHPQEHHSTLGHKRKASPSISVEEDRKSKEKKTCTEVVSVGTKAPSMNIHEAREFQEKKIGNKEISISSKAPSMNFREAYGSQEKQAGSEVISVGSKALSVNVEEAQKSRDKQTGTEVVSVGNEVPTVNVPEAYNPQEAELISMNSESLSLHDVGVWELQDNQIVPDLMSISIEAPSREPEEKQIGPELISVDSEVPQELLPAGITAISVNVQEVCMSPQKSQISPEVLSLGSKPIGDVVLLEDEEGIEKGRGSLFVQSRSPIRPPLGISLGAGSLPNRARSSATAFHLGTSVVSETCQSSAELPDTMSLKKLMEKRMEQEGLSLSLDCANLLNNALNVYMKRLIKASVDMARSRHSSDRTADQVKRRIHDIGTWQQAHKQKMNGIFSASVHDFKVAMQLEPKSLGVDWPVLLEKISLLTTEE